MVTLTFIIFVPKAVLRSTPVLAELLPSSETFPALWRLRNRFLHWTAGLPLMHPEMIFHRLPCFSRASKSFTSSASDQGSRPVEFALSNGNDREEKD